jgi:hypothetical protein
VIERKEEGELVEAQEKERGQARGEERERQREVKRGMRQDDGTCRTVLFFLPTGVLLESMSWTMVGWPLNMTSIFSSLIPSASCS